MQELLRLRFGRLTLGERQYLRAMTTMIMSTMELDALLRDEIEQLYTDVGKTVATEIAYLSCSANQAVGCSQ